MNRRNWLAKLTLLPISKLYGMGVWFRNWFFNIGLLKDKEFDVPVIVVGNLSAGGTGKTPHVEYLIDKLRHGWHVGMVSRGYKRDTSGFVMATRRSTPSDIGDEPYQIYHRFNCEVPVAVCEDRVTGISELLSIDRNINLIILDDGFQHRYVRPTVAIVLTEYNRPVFSDSLLPYGNLREPMSSLQRADIVIATKCSDSIRAIDYSIFEKNLGLSPWQGIYFSKMIYGRLMPVFPDLAPSVAPSLEWLTEQDSILAVAGIGNPKPFIKYIKRHKAEVKVNLYSDHHNYSKRDMAHLLKRFDRMEGRHKLLITTEKDAVRMANCPYMPHQLKAVSYYLPMRVDFMRDGGAQFIEHLRKLIKDKQQQTMS